MHTPKQSQENSPEDELPTVYNEATMNKPIFTEEEWLYMHSFVEDTLYNPVTMSFIEPDED